MIDRKFREFAVRAMFPSVSFDSPMWKDFVERGEERTNPASVRVARAMEALAKEIAAPLLAELEMLRRETSPTLPPDAWVPERGDQVRVKGTHRFAGARGRITEIGNKECRVLLMPSQLVAGGGSYDFKYENLEPCEAT